MPLKLVQRHSSPYWYIRGTVRGISVDESTGVSDRQAAEEIRILREAEVLKRSIHGDSATRTFAEAALSYMEAGGEREHLGPLLKHFAKTKLAAIGQAEIDAAAARLKPGLSPATLNRQIYTPMAAVLHHAARLKWCAKPVIARPSIREQRRWMGDDAQPRKPSPKRRHLTAALWRHDGDRTRFVPCRVRTNRPITHAAAERG